MNPLDEYIPMVEEMKQMMQGDYLWNCKECEHTEDECKDCYPELGYKNNKLKRDTEAVEKFVKSDAFEKLMESLDKQDIPTMYYPQVEGVTPTVVDAGKQEPFDEYGNYKYPSDFELTEPNTATSMPCDDAISHEDALMCLTGEIKETDTIETIIARFGRRIRKLSPVNPQPKTGHWKRISIDKYSEHAKYWYECDKCGKHNLGNTNFCPNCGAKMVEPQERSGEE